jgi:hypothetical protein
MAVLAVCFFVSLQPSVDHHLLLLFLLLLQARSPSSQQWQGFCRVDVPHAQRSEQALGQACLQLRFGGGALGATGL